METFLLAQGYALAGSAYKNNGWAIKEDIDDTRTLTHFFRDRFGKPDRTIRCGEFGSHGSDGHGICEPIKYERATVGSLSCGRP